MRKFSLVAGMLGCMSLLLLSPGVASAGIIASLSIDDLTESPSTSTSGFNPGFFSSVTTVGGNELISFSGSYNVSTLPLSNLNIETFVVLTEAGSTVVSDILDITLVQHLNSPTISINGTFTSVGDPGTTLIAPEGAITIAENGAFQDLSSILQSVGFRNDLQVQVRSDIDGSNGGQVPEPASMVVWSLIACGMVVPGLRRRWRTAAKAV